MSLKYGLFLPQGYVQELAGIKDPVDAYETHAGFMLHLLQPLIGTDADWNRREKSNHE